MSVLSCPLAEDLDSDQRQLPDKAWALQFEKRDAASCSHVFSCISHTKLFQTCHVCRAKIWALAADRYATPLAFLDPLLEVKLDRDVA